MISSFVLGMAGSAVVAILYGLLVAQKEEQIRHHLSTRRKGWARRVYVRAFVGAIRGRAAAANTSLLAFLILIIPLFISFYTCGAASKMEAQERFIDDELQWLNSKPEVTARTGPPSIREWPQTRIRGRHYIVVLRVSAGLALMAFYAGWFLWRPFLVMRQRFSYEIERFTLRIQGLASKAELAELAVAEANVIDEDTLRRFVEIARGVAMRHEIPQLVTTFDLWKDCSI